MDTIEQVNSNANEIIDNNLDDKVQQDIVESQAASIKEDTSNQDNNQDDIVREETSYGKFKTSEALLDAYNNLESEFTKKSQRLKELEKVDADKEQSPEETQPMYKGEQWQQQVSEFVSNNAIAQEYAEEIASEIMNDESLSRDKNCLSLALNKVLASKYRHPSEIVKDSEFLDSYVLSDDSIRQRVIADYLDTLNNRRPPEVITRKGEISLTPPHKPKTLAEAGQLAKKMLNRR